MVVRTMLTSGLAKSARHNVKGNPVDSNGEATLVGIANVERTGNIFLDKFLGLPNEALAILNCDLILIDE